MCSVRHTTLVCRRKFNQKYILAYADEIELKHNSELKHSNIRKPFIIFYDTLWPLFIIFDKWMHMHMHIAQAQNVYENHKTKHSKQ